MFCPFQMLYTALKHKYVLWTLVAYREAGDHSLSSEGSIQEQVANKEAYLIEGPSQMKPSSTDDNLS